MSLVRQMAWCAGLFVLAASSADAQAGHEHPSAAPRWGASFGASAIAYGTRVDPGVGGRTLAEGYLTQPLLHAHLQSPRDLLELRAMIDLEGRTLARGELTPGAYGEGFVDRRHPHTYLHEVVVTARSPEWRGFQASASVGKGFAPFGTDDPMSRPIVRFPVNHHLAQILERVVAIGAVRWRPLTIEAARFNGDEPESPGDAPNARSRNDSWAARATLRPAYAFARGIEAQWSLARVVSPESPTGHGFDHHKRSGSVRLERVVGSYDVYAFGEFARTDLYTTGRRAFTFHSALGEASAERGILRLSTRYEQTVRPEDERLTNVFRTVYPSAEVQILGATRFDIVTVNAEARTQLVGLTLSPFVEASLIHASPTVSPSAFVPREFYGANRQTQMSAGMRISAGANHGRMGRYGVAAAAHGAQH